MALGDRVGWGRFHVAFQRRRGSPRPGCPAQVGPTTHSVLETQGKLAAGTFQHFDFRGHPRGHPSGTLAQRGVRVRVYAL